VSNGWNISCCRSNTAHENRAERLATIEGRLTFEVKQGIEPPLHLSYVAKKELAQNREQLPYLAQELKEKHFLSDGTAQHCAQDILRYKPQFRIRKLIF
jgi:hypothetical protein